MLLNKLQEVRDGTIKCANKPGDDAFTSKVEDISQVVKLMHETMDKTIGKIETVHKKEWVETNVLKDEQFYSDKIKTLEKEIENLSENRITLKMKSLKEQRDFAINNAAKY